MGTLALFNTLSVNYGVNSASGLFGKPVCRLDGFLQMQIFRSRHLRCIDLHLGKFTTLNGGGVCVGSPFRRRWGGRAFVPDLGTRPTNVSRGFAEFFSQRSEHRRARRKRLQERHVSPVESHWRAPSFLPATAGASATHRQLHLCEEWSSSYCVKREIDAIGVLSCALFEKQANPWRLHLVSE